MCLCFLETAFLGASSPSKIIWAAPPQLGCQEYLAVISKYLMLFLIKLALKEPILGGSGDRWGVP